MNNVFGNVYQYAPETGGGGDVEADYPGDGDVREGIAFDYGNRIGKYRPANVADVVAGVTYGANGIEFVGTFVPSITLIISIDIDIVIGDDYQGERAFKWSYSDAWGDLGGYELMWELVYPQSFAKVIQLTPEFDGNDVVLTIDGADTQNLTSGIYRYGLRAYQCDGDGNAYNVRTLGRREAALSMPYAVPKR